MSELVHDLVSAAIDTSKSLTDLLRLALVVASCLDVSELAEWIKSELNGYSLEEEVPDYRRVRGQLMAENPARGLIPIIYSSETIEQLPNFDVRQVVFQQKVSTLISHAQDPSGYRSSCFRPDIEYKLIQWMLEADRAQMRRAVEMRPVLRLSTAQLQGILDTVRNRVLEWRSICTKRASVARA